MLRVAFPAVLPRAPLRCAPALLRRMASSASGSGAGSGATPFPTPVISTTEAESWLGAGKATWVDASWYLPTAGRDGKKEYEAKRIPGAVHFDINGPGLSDTSTTLPHMLPSASDFSPAAAKLGISKARPVVVYDGTGLFAAARVWWTLTAFGHPRVAVLSGGLPKWEAEGRPLDTSPASSSSSPSSASSSPSTAPETWTLNAQLVRSLEQVVRGTAERRVCAGNPALRDAELFVDARPAPRFEGDAPEPRPGLALGHIPLARSVPFSEVLDASAFNQLLPQDRLVEVFRAAGVDVSRPGPIVTSCGSGVTAAVVFLALAAAGRPLDRLALYDGSWAEYGGAPGMDIEKGKAEPGDASKL
jgi:thiosulfate/3-mercaptopyruvate sulfurtransferase